uniref:Uncharacterized protein n=1 Tax=Anguilla anguilla TaxID=7936 RepID=A0A0E9R776_ANGAN
MGIAPEDEEELPGFYSCQ